MQSSANTWKSDGEKPAKKGTRRSKNIMKPNGHVEPGLGRIDIDDTDLNAETTAYASVSTSGSSEMKQAASGDSLGDKTIIQLTLELLSEAATKLMDTTSNFVKQKFYILRYGKKNFVHDTAGGEMPDPDRLPSETEFH